MSNDSSSSDETHDTSKKNESEKWAAYDNWEANQRTDRESKITVYDDWEANEGTNEENKITIVPVAGEDVNDENESEKWAAYDNWEANQRTDRESKITVYDDWEANEGTNEENKITIVPVAGEDVNDETDETDDSDSKILLLSPKTRRNIEKTRRNIEQSAIDPRVTEDESVLMEEIFKLIDLGGYFSMNEEGNLFLDNTLYYLEIKKYLKLTPHQFDNADKSFLQKKARLRLSELFYMFHPTLRAAREYLKRKEKLDEEKEKRYKDFLARNKDKGGYLAGSYEEKEDLYEDFLARNKEKKEKKGYLASSSKNLNPPPLSSKKLHALRTAPLLFFDKEIKE